MTQPGDAKTADELMGAFARALEGLADTAPSPGAPPAEIIEARIRANVLEIVRKMLVLYHEAVWHGRGRAELLGLDESLEPAAQVAAAWTWFVATLRSDWNERLAADERFGREAEARKGRAQLSALRDAVAAWESLAGSGEDGDGGR